MRVYKLKKLKRVHGLHFSPDGKRLLAVGGMEVRMIDSAVWLDLETGDNPGRVDRFADCYAVDPALTRYVLGGANQWGRGFPVQWTDPAAPGEWHEWPVPGKPPRGSVGGLAFDATGTRLAVALNRQLPRRPGASERPWRHEVSVSGPGPAAPGVTVPVGGHTHVLAFNNGGTRIAVTGGVDGDTAVEVHDLAAGKLVYRFEPPGTVTRAVLFLPDDRLVVANGRNVYLLPAGTPEPPLALAGHPKQVNAVARTPDAHRLLTASHDGSIRVWHADTGEAVSGFDWQIGPVTAVAFAPDGLTCAAAGLNGRVVVWDVDG